MSKNCLKYRLLWAEKDGLKPARPHLGPVGLWIDDGASGTIFRGGKYDWSSGRVGGEG